MTLLERYCAWSIEELNDETGLYTEEKLHQKWEKKR